SGCADVANGCLIISTRSSCISQPTRRSPLSYICRLPAPWFRHCLTSILPHYSGIHVLPTLRQVRARDPDRFRHGLHRDPPFGGDGGSRRFFFLPVACSWRPLSIL